MFVPELSIVCTKEKKEKLLCPKKIIASRKNKLKLKEEKENEKKWCSHEMVSTQY